MGRYEGSNGGKSGGAGKKGRAVRVNYSHKSTLSHLVLLLLPPPSPAAAAGERKFEVSGQVTRGALN